MNRSALEPRARNVWVPLGSLDPAIIERARAINADTLEALDDLLGQGPGSGRGSRVDLDAAAVRGIADLTLALDRERRLIGDLYRAMVRQRRAVARGDMAEVEASIRLATGALLTLQETQRYRATLLQRLVGGPGQPLQSLEAHCEAGLPEPFLVARRQLRRSATHAAEEVLRTQGVLLVTLREREAMLRELLTGSRPTPAARWAAPTAEG
jgi:hypothetical protein